MEKAKVELNKIFTTFIKKIILKNYCVAYDNKKLELFDLKGNLLDIFFSYNFITPHYEFNKFQIYSNFENYFRLNIIDIKIINDYNIIVVFLKKIYLLEIKNKKFEIIIRVENEKIINSVIYIKKNKLLVISHTDNIKIIDIISKRNIQSINNYSLFLFNFNNKIFIDYNYKFLSFYQNITGTNFYQLTSNMQLNGRKEIIKLNEKTIMVLLDYIKYI